jgi:hypothetical protein
MTEGARAGQSGEHDGQTDGQAATKAILESCLLKNPECPSSDLRSLNLRLSGYAGGQAGVSIPFETVNQSRYARVHPGSIGRETSRGQQNQGTSSKKGVQYSSSRGGKVQKEIVERLSLYWIYSTLKFLWFDKYVVG